MTLGRIVDRLEEGAIVVLLTVMTLLTFVQVVLRHIFNSGFLWSLEVTTYAFAWMVLIGMSYGIRTNSHMVVDVVVRWLPSRPRRVVALTAVALSIAYAGVMFHGSYLFVDFLMEMGHDARDIALPRWALTIMAPIGFALLGLRLLGLGFDILRGRRQHIGSSEEEAGLGDFDQADGGSPPGTPGSGR